MLGIMYEYVCILACHKKEKDGEKGREKAIDF